MFKYEPEKEYGLPFGDCLREIRLSRYPLKVDENIMVYDRLESEGVIRLYEYLGGGFCIPLNLHEMEFCKNVVLVAEMSIVVRNETKEIQIERLFCEYGYEFEHELFKQVMVLANLFDFRVSVLKLDKCKKSCCRVLGKHLA